MTDTQAVRMVLGLLPCPFCGGKAEIERFGNTRVSTIYSCDECGCSLETGEEFNHGRAWNRRAAAPSVQPDREVIERVQQMVVDCEADPDGPLMLAASVAKEHAADLRAILSALQPVAQKEEG